MGDGIKRRRAALIAAGACFLLAVPALSATTPLPPGHDLQQAINAAASGDTLLLSEGTYAVAEPLAKTDSLCADCPDPGTSNSFTLGWHIKDKRLHIVGRGPGRTVLRTNAGYGLLFNHADSSSLADLTVTGGVRDADSRATSAAVVVRETRLTLRNCHLRDNDHQASGVIQGISGLAVREGGDVLVDSCLITGNSWDGVGLYRGASGTIRNSTISDGRGIGIRASRDAKVVVEHCTVHDYWKGIGIFMEAQGEVHDSVVRDLLGWGMAASGTARIDLHHNLIARAGNAGLSIVSRSIKGTFNHNIIWFPGRRKKWDSLPSGVVFAGPNDELAFHHNVIWSPEAPHWISIERSRNDLHELQRELEPGYRGEDPFMVMDPGFSNPEENDFTLRPTSELWPAAGDSLQPDPLRARWPGPRPATLPELPGNLEAAIAPPDSGAAADTTTSSDTPP